MSESRPLMAIPALITALANARQDPSVLFLGSRLNLTPDQEAALRRILEARKPRLAALASRLRDAHRRMVDDCVCLQSSPDTLQAAKGFVQELTDRLMREVDGASREIETTWTPRSSPGPPSTGRTPPRASKVSVPTSPPFGPRRRPPPSTAGPWPGPFPHRPKEPANDPRPRHPHCPRPHRSAHLRPVQGRVPHGPRGLGRLPLKEAIMATLLPSLLAVPALILSLPVVSRTDATACQTG